MLSTERHDGFFPWLGVAKSHLRATRLSLAVLRVYLQNLHLEQLFDSRSHVGLCRQTVHFKRVGVAASRTVHPLFGHQRLDDDLMRFEDDARCLWYMSWHNIFLGFQLYAYAFWDVTAPAAEDLALI